MTTPSQDFVDECMHWRGVLLTGTGAHWCGEWDDLPVDETCDEWGSDPEKCMCGFLRSGSQES